MIERMTEEEIAELNVRRINRDGTAEVLCTKAFYEITALRAEVERLKDAALFNDISVLPEKDAEYAALRAEVESKNDEFQKYARRMEADMNELGAENARLTARVRELEEGLYVIGYSNLSLSAAADEENRRHARSLLPSESGEKKGGE